MERNTDVRIPEVKKFFEVAGIMADALGLSGNGDRFTYCRWAWTPPEDEESVYPKPEDYE